MRAGCEIVLDLGVVGVGAELAAARRPIVALDAVIVGLGLDLTAAAQLAVPPQQGVAA